MTAALPAAADEVLEGERLEAPAFLGREPRAQHGTRKKPSASLVLGSPPEVRKRRGETKEESDHEEAMAWSELGVVRERGGWKVYVVILPRRDIFAASLFFFFFLVHLFWLNKKISFRQTSIKL